jgi:hypothetical protein
MIWFEQMLNADGTKKTGSPIMTKLNEEHTFWVMTWSVLGLVFIVITGLSLAYFGYTNKLKYENGYEEQMTVGSQKTTWVKASDEKE